MALMERTYAVLVAIETYLHLGDAWKLPGAAAQAARFAAWLIKDRGLPTANIQVFQSEADVQPFTSLGIPAGQCKDANAASINPFFADIGKDWPEGEVLLIYWIGHGFVSRDGGRRLILGDATDNTKTNLDINQLIKLLRSDLAGKFSQQIAFIDTCARFFESLQSASGLPEGGLSLGGQQRKDISQHFYFAASSGEYAKNTIFGPQVLELLKAWPKETWPPSNENLRKLRNDIEDRFDRFVAQGLARQHPVWLGYCANSDDWSSLMPKLDDIQAVCQRANFPVLLLRNLTEYAARCKTLDERQGRDQLYQSLQTTKPLYRPEEAKNDLKLDLMRLIAGVIEQGKIADLVNKIIELESNSDEADRFEKAALYVETLRELWPILAPIKLPLSRGLALYKQISSGLLDPSSNPGSFEEILDVLLDRNDKIPLLEFLLRIAREFPAKPECRSLMQWLEQQTHWANELQEAKSVLQKKAECQYLLTEIGELDQVCRVTRYWLWSKSNGFQLGRKEFDPQGDLSGDIAFLLNEVTAEGGEVYLEILAPENLLHLERGRLAWNNRGELLDPEYDNPVSLRWRDRMAQPRDPSYQAGRWKKADIAIRQRLSFQQACAFWPDKSGQPFRVGEDGELIGIPYSSADATREDLVTMICNDGIPYACWPRHGAVDLHAAEHSFRQLIAQCQFDEIPKALCPCRSKNSHPLADILLLWDDPKRNPYDNKLQETPQGGQTP